MAGCSGPALFTGRNTAKLFVDQEGGSTTQIQHLVMPGVLEQPEEPPEQSTCCTGSLVQFFNLVDPAFGGCVCMCVRTSVSVCWHWPRSSSISVPAGGRVLPGVPWLLGPCPPFYSHSSLAGASSRFLGWGVLYEVRLLSLLLPWSRLDHIHALLTRGELPDILTATYWAIQRHDFSPRLSSHLSTCR